MDDEKLPILLNKQPSFLAEKLAFRVKKPDFSASILSIKNMKT
jgi:hypothetical protein